MNPHDRTKNPGAHLVSRELGATYPLDLAEPSRSGPALAVVGLSVAEAAGTVDNLHGRLAETAQHAIHKLKDAAAGSPHILTAADGLLEDTGPTLEKLAQRRADAYSSLIRTIGIYKGVHQALNPQAANERLHAPAVEQVHATGHDNAVDPDVEAALRTVQDGGVLLREDILYHFQYVTDAAGKGTTVSERTVQRMLHSGLLEQDTSTSLHRDGQLLSLTPKGQEALQASRRSSARTDAALSRTAAGIPGAAPARLTAAPASNKPTRTR